MRRAREWIVGFMLMSAVSRLAAQTGLAGDWMTPGASVVRVGRCGETICLMLVKVAPDVKVSSDTRNPDARLRTRPLCGLQIGEGFVPQGPDAANGGRLYDPESGKTYSGKLAMEGGRLKLRGYVCVSLFGRSEVWKRVGTVDACKQG